MPNNYYISEIAYTTLVNLGIQQGFINRTSKNAVGMSRFLERLSFCEFEDTRPSYAYEIHREELATEHQPKWALEGEPRISRFFTLSDEAMQNYTESAFKLQVIITRPLANGGQGKNTILRIVGVMLEAIGLEWVTPLTLPAAVPTEHKYDKKSTRSHKRIAKASILEDDNPYIIYTRDTNRPRSGAPRKQKVI
jgi:hypothetical protein